MVSPQVTHEVQSPHLRRGDDPITAEVRRRVLRDHYEQRVSYQHAVTLEASRNRDALTVRFRTNPESVRPYQIDEANRQLTAARTVEQDVRAVLAAYSDNRDFRGVAR